MGVNDNNKNGNNKRKKFHDKDKYYRLAKEQGLRSRAAFKLSQINRQFPVLEQTRTSTVLDLCAAPGGWTQIAARTCSKATQIVAVDILPIRNLGLRNVHTIVGDITTDKCKSDIRRTLKDTTSQSNVGRDESTTATKDAVVGIVDVVLHDGAPNIGASYDKDAYEQLELCLHALKCATDHLKRGGTFITKVYRSRDSNSLVWVLQQLFQQVESFKPKASRTQSAEIFYVCRGYYAPHKLDPRMLDPSSVFQYVEGSTDGGDSKVVGSQQGSSKYNVFHKAWDQSRRSRGGYDLEHLDATLRHIEPVTNFVFGRLTSSSASQEDGSSSSNNKESATAAIQVLSTCTGLTFRIDSSNNNKGMVDDDPTLTTKQRLQSQFLLNHPLTSGEIKECLIDLKLLNKSDFKGLMTWRDKMLNSWKEFQKDQQMEDEESSDDDDDSDDGEEASDDENRNKAGSDNDDEDDEDQIQKEIQAMREKKLREKKRLKKKERKVLAKKRRQAALGMDLNAIEVQEHDQFFSLASVGMTTTRDLEKVSEVNLDQVTKEEAFGRDDDDDDDDGDNDHDVEGKLNVPDRDEDTGYSYRLDGELDAAYARYLESTKNATAKSGTQASKRSKRLMREKLAQESHEDSELLLSKASGLDHDAKVYAKLLTKGNDGADDDSDDDDENENESGNDDDDGFDAEPMAPDEHEEQQRAKKKAKLMLAKTKGVNPLLSEFPDDDPASAKTARWFSNPLFAQIGQVVNEATTATTTTTTTKEDDSDDEDNIEKSSRNKKVKISSKNKNTKRSAGSDSEGSDDDDDDEMLDADGVLAMMPKTDKQKRHEKRIKAKERDERRQKRRAKRLGETEADFDLVPAQDDDGDEEDDEFGENDPNMEGLSDERKRKLIEARKLIKAGMGSQSATPSASSLERFEEVVAEKDALDAERPLPVRDTRKYDSDHEEYDSDDHAETMALGTMMLRQSKAKQLVDASYNRFAWNDPSDLPEWFVDDENRHYRPQLPIPAALVAKMKEKMLALSTKPIAKVAEARARKNRKAKLKLAAAKKKAQTVANSSEMSDSMKLKSISKALRSEDSKNSGKKYVVAKKSQGKYGVKGATLVDKRLKSDKRSMDRSTKKKKNGKKGGLTGGKRRRHHK